MENVKNICSLQYWIITKLRENSIWFLVQYGKLCFRGSILDVVSSFFWSPCIGFAEALRLSVCPTICTSNVKWVNTVHREVESSHFLMHTGNSWANQNSALDKDLETMPVVDTHTRQKEQHLLRTKSMIQLRCPFFSTSQTHVYLAQAVVCCHP